LFDPDSDGVRLVQRLESKEFQEKVQLMVNQMDWEIWIDPWSSINKDRAFQGQHLSHAYQILAEWSNEVGWNFVIEKKWRAEDAIAAGESIVNQIIQVYQSMSPIWKQLIPQSDLDFLEGGESLHKPQQTHEINLSSDYQSVLTTTLHNFHNNGLHFTPQQIATFYTALQTKGFVVLSGISGTGKSKLAQHFAAMLPRPQVRVEVQETLRNAALLSVQPYMLKYNRLIIPQQMTRWFTPPEPGKTIEVNVTYTGGVTQCRFNHAKYTGTQYLGLLLKGGVRKWFQESFSEGAQVGVEPQIDEETGDLTGFRLFNPADIGRPSETVEENNWLFLPVRPDWRDSKSLLGYFNPITQNYEWTDFLHFLRKAELSYRNQDGLAWFVILDEMNLAHVEYYFADLLSVLESGRDAEGWTREPLRFPHPAEADLSDLPPATIHLPPNLYIVGTVNVDETTHAFSPKVLDRAFTIELNEVDFSAYPVDPGETEPLAQAKRAALLENFSFSGRFVHRDKAEIANYVESHLWVRDQLQQLNELLRPHGRHFGYRVFDEIVTFLIAAEHNGLFAELGGERAAFDAAVLMKVLPKFHGSRNALDAPLRGILAWCLNSETASVASVNEILDSLTNAHSIHTALEALGGYQYPATAHRVERMLWELRVNGFTAF
jgi:energy-coupling factor transporter ATP-binding protein EcfA2